MHRLFENLDNPHLTAIDRMGLFDDQVKFFSKTSTLITFRLMRFCMLVGGSTGPGHSLLCLHWKEKKSTG